MSYNKDLLLKGVEMHSQLLLDNTRPGAGDATGRFSSRLAADLIHSMLFHEEIAYLDSYLINNYPFRRILSKFPVVTELLQERFCTLFKDDRFPVTANKVAYNAKMGQYHPAFRGVSRYMDGVDKVISLVDKMSQQTYSYVQSRNEFTTQLLSFLSTEYAATKLAGMNNEVSESIQSYLNDKKSAYAVQGDFEGASEVSLFEEFLNRSNSLPSYKQIKTQFLSIEQFVYRSTLMSGNNTTVIMHPEHTTIYREINASPVTSFGKPLRISSSYFRTSNLLRLHTEDVMYLRGTAAFKEFQHHIKSSSDMNQSAALLKEYIAVIERKLKDLGPKRNIVAVNQAEKTVSVGVAISASAIPDDLTHRIEILVNVADILSNADPMFPSLGQFGPVLVQLSKVAPSVKLGLGRAAIVAANLLPDLVLGQQIDASLFQKHGEYDTGYAS